MPSPAPKPAGPTVNRATAPAPSTRTLSLPPQHGRATQSALPGNAAQHAAPPASLLARSLHTSTATPPAHVAKPAVATPHPAATTTPATTQHPVVIHRGGAKDAPASKTHVDAKADAKVATKPATPTTQDTPTSKHVGAQLPPAIAHEVAPAVAKTGAGEAGGAGSPTAPGAKPAAGHAKDAGPAAPSLRGFVVPQAAPAPTQVARSAPATHAPSSAAPRATTSAGAPPVAHPSAHTPGATAGPAHAGMAAAPAHAAGIDAALPAERSAEAATGDADLARLAAAPPSAAQALALAQAQRVIADCSRSEALVTRLGAQRVQALHAFSAGARASLFASVAAAGAAVQARVASLEAALSSSIAAALGAIRGALGGAVQAAHALVSGARVRLDGFVASAGQAMQQGVDSVANGIVGLIDAIPLPDIPGIGAIRSTAVSLLQRGAGVVRGALGTATQALGSAIDGGLALLDGLLAGIGVVVDTALALIEATLQSLLQVIARALQQAVSLIGAALRGLLDAVVMPLLARVESLLTGGLLRVAREALHRLRANRAECLAALADSVAPRQPAAVDTASSEAEYHAALRRLGQDALRNDALIVLGFDALTGGLVGTVLGLLATAASRILSGISLLLTQALTALQALAQNVQLAVGQFMQAAIAFVADLLSSAVEAVASLVTWAGGIANGVRDTLLRYARQAAAGVGSLVRGLVRALIGGGDSAHDVEAAAGDLSLTGSITPALGGPITKPSPGPIVIIIKILAPLVIAGVATLMTFLFGAQLAAIIMANPVLAIAILVILLLVLLLALWLLIKLYRLIKSKPPKTKRVLAATPAVLELGVGGRDVAASARIAPGSPAVPRLKWTVNPGGHAPAGVAVRGSGVRVAVRASQPPLGTVVGGTPITVRAELASDPSDFADSAPVMLVQVLSVRYVAAPALADVPYQTFVAPHFPNTAEPNRDGIAGNTATVDATTAPATRPVDVSFRRALGAGVAGNVVTPGRDTGDIRMRIEDHATRARLNEKQLSTSGPTRFMADMAVNVVPTKVASLAGAGPIGPYGVQNRINYAPSDREHLPVTRVVGELITGVADSFNIAPPNGGFNPGYRPDLAVPANLWTDQLITPFNVPNAADGLPAIDVNRFIGPTAPGLPARLIYRQQFVYKAWQGGGGPVSSAFADGQHIRSLVGSAPAAFRFTTEHRFGSTAAPKRTEPYIGNPLIVFSNITVAPNAPGATAWAADGNATAELGVTSSVAGRSVNWSALGGGLTVVAGNPAALPATATFRAGASKGRFGVRAADTVFANRRLDGKVRLVDVSLSGMRASPRRVPSGTASSTVSLNANPGGRTVNWSVDAAAAAAGVTVTPNVTGPGPAAMSVTVTRPAGFVGTVTVSAADSVLAGRTSNISVRFK